MLQVLRRAKTARNPHEPLVAGCENNAPKEFRQLSMEHMVKKLPMANGELRIAIQFSYASTQ